MLSVCHSAAFTLPVTILCCQVFQLPVYLPTDLFETVLSHPRCILFELPIVANLLHLHQYWSRRSQVPKMGGLPAYLFDTYKQGKRDTALTVTWLAQQTKSLQLPFSASNLVAPTVLRPVKTKKQLQKAEKAAKALRASTEPSTASDIGKPFVVNDLPFLAKQIATARPAVTIPKSLLATINRAIQARK